MQKLADVISLAERAQQSAMTPEQLAEDARRDAIQARSYNLALAAPPIPPAAVSAIVRGELEQTPHLLATRDWLRGANTILILAGGVGVGKTVAASWALSEQGGKIIHASQLARYWQGFDREERAEWGRCADAHILVVDDVAEERDADKFAPALTELLSDRCRHHGRTIITSNLTAQMLQERYDDPKLWSRIRQSCSLASKDATDLRVKK